MNEEPQVLYCDAWLMAIDKPAGMIVHGDGTGERTLTDYASDLLLAMGDGFAATDMQPLNRLTATPPAWCCFRSTNRRSPPLTRWSSTTPSKSTICAGRGQDRLERKLIDKPIARDRHDSRKMRVGASGKRRRRAKVLKRLKSRRGLPARSYIDVELLNGRKHQIRVHLASEHHPWLATTCTARRVLCGLMLHAHSVSLRIP
ncbi:MAG: RluA family pseudouridine synthase [Collinsella sp.]